jgi:type IV pilus assembly protein PilB
MGLEPYLISSAITCVVAQRLIRRLCERCKQAYVPSPMEAGLLYEGHPERDAPAELFRPSGCAACAKTGYHGRFALHEVMLVSEEVSGLIADRANSDDIRKSAITEGMITLREAGVANVVRGKTSLEELMRVVA